MADRTEPRGADAEVLVRLRDAVYGGSWDRMREDLVQRLAARPYHHARHERIAEDLRVVEAMLRGASR